MFKSAFLLSLVLSSVLFSVSSIAQVRPASPAPKSVAPTQPVVNEDANVEANEVVGRPGRTLCCQHMLAKWTAIGQDGEEPEHKSDEDGES